MISERHVARQSLFACLALSLFGVAHAADTKPTNDKLPGWAPPPKPHVVEDRFRVEVMTLSANLDTDVRIDPNLVTPGTLISAEDDLGLDDHKLLPLAEITLLPGDRHLIRLSGFSLRRSARKAIDETIVFDDQTYLPDEIVDSTLNLTSVGLTYGYSIVKMRSFDLALSFGIQVVEVEANAVVRSRVVRESETGVTPLPLAGIEGRYDFNDRWSFEARVQYLSVEFDEIDGSVLDARAALTWRMNPYLVFGLGYRNFDVEVDSRDVDDPGLFDLKMAGPLLFLRASL
ncbi:porin family protein [Peristeroidobacter agariperforans]|uniref:porin family protein n=1 Tax=Peristeroidobacter agariperforans TaxID=268404 RepID=UPI00101C9BF3|nr:porin family protein [Peristeroidobacter agariperforans]